MRSSIFRFSTRGFCKLVVLLCSGCLAAAASVASPASCSEETVSVHCGSTPTAVWHKGAFWVVFTQGDHVYFTRTRDGNQFSKPVVVNQEAQKIDANGESRPKIAMSGDIAVVSWTEKTSAKYTGAVHVSRSTDGGASFTAPRPVPALPGSTSQRFDSLSVAADGTAYLAWLDKTPSEADGEDTISALVYAVSRDQGSNFSGPFKVADSSCECCRIAAQPHAAGIDLLWRHIYGDNIRDHAFARISEGKTPRITRATVDNWRIHACPHHGPAMAAAAEGAHLAWFTNGSERSGLHYGLRLADGELTQLTAMDKRPGASHPQVLLHENRLYYAWKYFNGTETKVLLTQSQDGGKTWQAPQTLATTEGPSDHPHLLPAGNAAVLSWHTQTEGLRLTPLAPMSFVEGD